ncbi:hypothetical protein VNO77_00939 [Canavalia gladiata]|uniref:Uncharacterized protein n=1 Tax=Canavalia gladiata TaxID=3824 RepID=A0AAN9MR12_CANGL
MESSKVGYIWNFYHHVYRALCPKQRPGNSLEHELSTSRLQNLFIESPIIIMLFDADFFATHGLSSGERDPHPHPSSFHDAELPLSLLTLRESEVKRLRLKRESQLQFTITITS